MLPGGFEEQRLDLALYDGMRKGKYEGGEDVGCSSDGEGTTESVAFLKSMNSVMANLHQCLSVCLHFLFRISRNPADQSKAFSVRVEGPISRGRSPSKHDIACRMSYEVTVIICEAAV